VGKAGESCCEASVLEAVDAIGSPWSNRP